MISSSKLLYALQAADTGAALGPALPDGTFVAWFRESRASSLESSCNNVYSVFLQNILKYPQTVNKTDFSKS